MSYRDSDRALDSENSLSPDPPQRIRHFLFCAQNDDVAFVSDGCADVLRVANKLMRKDRFSWSKSIGLAALNANLKTKPAGLAIVLVGSSETPWQVKKDEMALLRPRLQSAVHLGIIGAGIFPLRKSGSHQEKTLAVHPSFRLAISEIAPLTASSSRQVTHARGISAAAGGVAAIRMMTELVGQQVGDFTERGLREYLGMSPPRDAFDSPEHWRLVRKSQGNPVIGKALAVMAENLEDPLPTHKIAEAIQLSPRQLERNFASHLELSPLQAYRNLRLDRARQLLTQTSLSISEIAVACGFGSTGSMSKWYRETHGESPGEARRRAYIGNS